MDAPQHTCHGSSSMLDHTFSSQLYLCRTSHSDCCSASHALHRIFCLSASGIRDKSMDASVSLASFHLPIEKAATVFCSATALSSFAFASLTLSHGPTVSNLILLYCFRNRYFIQGIPVKAEHIVNSVPQLNGDLFPSHIGQVPQFQYWSEAPHSPLL